MALGSGPSSRRPSRRVHFIGLLDCQEILKEAAKVDEAEGELYGDARGDELPEHLRANDGRRAALREARPKLDREEKEYGSGTTEAPEAGSPRGEDRA
jgi:hypothetical protein